MNFSASLYRLSFISTFLALLAVIPIGIHSASAADAALSVTAPVNVPGATATLSASGFGAGETLHIVFGAESVHVATNESGSVSAPLPIPHAPSGLQFASAYGESSGKWAIAYFWVAGLNPLVAPQSWFIAPGQALSFSGTGFGLHEPVTALYGSTTLATYTTDGSGSFSGPATPLPVSLANTTATINFAGASSTARTSVTLTIGQLYPSITPSSWYTAAGSIISLTGSGFAANESVTITAGSVTASSTANASGAITLPALQLPSTGGSTVSIVAIGGASGAAASANVTLASLSPWLTFSTYWAKGGSPLTIFGNGFAAMEQVSLASGTTAIGTTTANASGGFEFVTTVPYAPSGNISVTGTGRASGGTGAGEMTVAPVYTDLQLASYAGAPGSAITFIGNGYLPNEPVVLTTDRTGSTTVATWNADAGGSFSNGSYIVPGGFTEGLLSLTLKGLYSFTTKTILYYVTGG